MNRRPSSGNASALLAKVSSQLKGGHRQPAAVKEDDDGENIEAYLKSLNRKSVREEPQWDKFGEKSDLSDDEPRVAVSAANSTSVSKFLKKKPVTDDVTHAAKPQLTTPSRTIRDSFPAKSSALNKAQSLVTRYSINGTQNKLGDSDSDMDLSLDEDVIADVKALKRGVAVKQAASGIDTGKVSTSTVVNSASKVASSLVPQNAVSIIQSHQPLPTSNLFRSAANQPDSDEDDASESLSARIGTGGSKFMKKRQSVTQVFPEVKESSSTAQVKIVNGASRAVTTLSLQKTLKNVDLDSDDESIAEFINGLSPKAVSGTAEDVTQASKIKNSSQLSRTSVKQPVQVVAPSESDSSVSETANIRLNIGNLDELIAQDDDQTDLPIAARHQRKTLSSSSVTETKKSASSECKPKPSKPDGAILGYLGLHSVDELLDKNNDVDDLKLSFEAQQYESDFESVGALGSSSSRIYSPSPVVPPLRSILSLTPRSLTPKSNRSRVRLMDDLTVLRSRSPSPISTGRSTAEIPEDDDDAATRSAATVMTYTDSTDPSDSETTRAVSDSEVSRSSVRKAHRSRSQSEERRSSAPSTTRRRSTSSSVSPVHSRRSSRSSRRESEVSYSEDFTSAAVSQDESSRSDDTRGTSVAEGDSHAQHKASGKSSTKPSRRSVRSRGIDSTTKDCSVQTGLDVGLYYNWPSGSKESVASAQYGLAFVDPASVAVSVVSADALEAMTGYTPSAIALNDLVSQQVVLTRQHVAMQTRLHCQLVDSLLATNPPYHYTTFQDTREYIRRNRPRVLTFEQALKQVQQESC